MPRRARSAQRGTYFHVINRTARRFVLFTQPADYRAFLSILSQALEQHPVRLIAYSLMPSHWQLVVGPTDSDAVARCVHRVTSTHAVRLGRPQGALADQPAYEGRVTSVELRQVEDLVRICRLVERDPLHAGLARRAQDWPWSSLADRLLASPRVPLVNTPFLSSRAWAEYVNASRSSDGSASGHVSEPPGRLA